MKKLSTLMVLLCLCLSAGAQYSLTKIDVNNQAGSAPARFTGFKDRTYFIADDGVHGYELWWSDGHSYGLLADINPGAASAFDPNFMSSNNLLVLNDKLYFAARDSAHGIEIWEYNGTSQPRMVIDADTANGYDIRGQLTAVNGWIYFKARRAMLGPMIKIFRLNPLTHVTEEVLVNVNLNLSDPMVAFDGQLLFTGIGNSGYELYEYDPVLDVTNVRDLNPGSSSSTPGGFYGYKKSLFFLAFGAGVGRELWRYDAGTAPRRISDINAGNFASSFGTPGLIAEKMAVYNNKLYFMAMNGPSFRYQLYNYDPLTEVISQVTEMNSGTSATGMAVYGRKLWFSSDSSANLNPGLFYYDGASTKHVSTLGFNTFTIPRHLTESNGRLYFSDWDFTSSSFVYEPYVFTDSLALDVQEVVTSSNVKIYPNPATSLVQVDLSLNQNAVLQVVLTDMQGRVVYSASKQYAAGRAEILVPVRELAAGVYTYTVVANETVTSRGKLIKQ